MKIVLWVSNCISSDGEVQRRIYHSWIEWAWYWWISGKLGESISRTRTWRSSRIKTTLEWQNNGEIKVEK